MPITAAIAMARPGIDPSGFMPASSVHAAVTTM